MNRTKRIVTISFLLACGVLLAACAQVSDWFSSGQADPTPLPVVESAAKVVAEGRAVPEQYATLAFPVSGKLGDLPAIEGEQVEQGALLAQMDQTEQVQADLAQAEANLEVAQQAYDQLKDDAALVASQADAAVASARKNLVEAQHAYDELQKKTFQDQLDDKEEALQDRKSDLDDAQETKDRYENLDENNPTRVNAENDYDSRLEAYNQALYERDALLSQQETAEANLNAASDALDKAVKDAADVASGPDPDELAKTEKQLAAAQAQVDAARRALADLELRAPFAGMVAEVKQLAAGVWLNAGQAVTTVIDPSSWYVETTDLTELDVVSVQVGDAASVTFDAIDGQRFSGTVMSVGQTYTEKSGDILYKVRIRLENPPDAIRWGMTASISMGE